MIRAAALAAVAIATPVMAGDVIPVIKDAEISRIEHQSLNFGVGVTVIRDEKRAVTCWVTQSPRDIRGGGGISCLPDWMLTNGQRDLLVAPEAYQ